MTTEDFFDHDRCPRFHQYSTLYSPFRVSSHAALNESLHRALSHNNPIFASDHIMALAANPGIDLKSANLYPSIIHHSKLVELLATYILSVSGSTVPKPISTKWGDFQPQSFLLPDGRLRRIVLCDRWTPEREQLERFSWRTVADTAITNRPMVITALLIGSLRDGLRPSGWTQGFIHPQNGSIRIQKRDGKFGESWKRTWREQSGTPPLDWLGMMQSDGVFEDLAFSITEDVPINRAEILDQLSQMAHEMTSPIARQTRSACYRFTPCPFLLACSSVRSPSALGWTEKPTPSPLPMLVSS